MLLSENSASETAPGSEPRAYVFGSFTLDLQQGVLLKDGDAVALRPKTFDALRVLVEHPQQLLERESLMRMLWPGLVVTDDSLTQCLTEIRRALGDDQRSMIRTVPGRGYRLEVRVQPLFAQEVTLPAASSPGSFTRQRLLRVWAPVVLIALALGVIAAWWHTGSAPQTAAQTLAEWQPPPASVAVLAFADMSPQGDQEYLADGLAEEILNVLAQQDALTVIARTSSFAFKGENLDIGTIARRLNVSHVLEGSVRKAGDRVRITAQLVDGQTGAHVWSETFDRRLGDVFATQDEIAGAVAGVLQTRLSGGGKDQLALGAVAPRPPDPEAWELYLRGRYLYGRRMAGDRVQAQRYFEQALQIDPGFAAAWVALAATYNVRANDADLADAERLDRAEALPLMHEALARALTLDPGHPEALLRMAVFEWREGNTEEAVAKMEQAMRTGRNHALVQSILGGLAFRLGDPVTGAILQGRAVRLDPLSATHLGNYAQMLFFAGRFGEADTAIRESEKLNPDYEDHNRLNRLWIALLAGEYEAAAELARRTPAGTQFDLMEAMLAFAGGDQAASHAAMQRLLSSTDPQASSFEAIAHAFRGETDAAFLALEAALEDLPSQPERLDGRGLLVQLRHSPFLKPLHEDPRWASWSQRAVERYREVGDEGILASLAAYAAEVPNR